LRRNTKCAITDLEDTVKSVSNSVTAYRDLTNNNDVNILAYVLSESIVNRVIDHNYGPATVLSITIKNSNLDSFTRQITLSTPILTVKDVQKIAFELFKEHYTWDFPVRSFGISLSGFLDNHNGIDSKTNIKLKKLEKTIKNLTDVNGKSVVSSGVSLYDRKLIDQKFHDKGITD
jgi:DNA polymerase-4